MALARQLMTQSATVLDTQYDLALLLGAEALNTSATAETEGMMNYELIYNPYLSAYLRGHADKVNTVTLSADGRLLVSGSDDGQNYTMGCDEKRAFIAPARKPPVWRWSNSFKQQEADIGIRKFVLSIEVENSTKCVEGEIAIWGLDEKTDKPKILLGHEDGVRDLDFQLRWTVLKFRLAGLV